MGYGPIQWGSRCLAVVLRPVLVDLVARVVVGNHRHGLLEFCLLESRIIGPIYDAFPRKPLFFTQGAALHWQAVQVLVVLVRKVPMPHLVADFGPPFVLATLPVNELRDALHGAGPKELLAVVPQRVLRCTFPMRVTDSARGTCAK